MKKSWRHGYTTGACAAAAAKAAALLLFHGVLVQEVRIKTPQGKELVLPVASAEKGEGWARCGVVKDAGDDPDVTHGLTVYATVAPAPELRLEGGPGVGVVTRPGLPVPPGEPAINPGPRQMILEAVREVLPPGQGAVITVSVPGGEEVAARTFNPRLGIVGGISILGTTGIVVPFSEEAYRESLKAAVNVAVAEGQRILVLVPGRSAERLALGYGFPAAAVVPMANYVGFLLQHCAEAGVEGVLLWGQAGKLLKVAGGIFNTHSRVADARLEVLAALAAAEGASPFLVGRVLEAATVEEAAEWLAKENLERTWHRVAARAALKAREYTEGKLQVGAVLFDREGKILGCSEEACTLASQLGVDLAFPFSSLSPGVYLVGVGPGDPAYLTPAAWRVIRGAKLVVGAPKVLKRLGLTGEPLLPPFASLFTLLERESSTSPVAVLVSGDPGLFSILQTLRRELPQLPLRVVPGISAVSTLFARLGKGYEEARFLSLHGRGTEEELLAEVKRGGTVVVLTGPAFPPQRIGEVLAAAGYGDLPVAVGADLTLAEEKLLEQGEAGQLAKLEGDWSNAVVVIFA
ncbi:cobalt-precorrin-5B (C(1))-methyltransferase CbiD [Ammonifex thiophilus]|uniref:Cobalt-precorrin-5B C(1)-methyltransferase n=1 Tax=Ammonifex thiophilus TaxID=444093 RepID=A0A3D8P5P7_9THEO|nr:cobalt-precorrin-5B (C(1))-methyltransferase CbiD [Ammonifex thiophilus]RDV83632.1 cobalt-precorrin-5B (C(1))-methyltransferase [Ammonifex thiophilus]